MRTDKGRAHDIQNTCDEYGLTDGDRLGAHSWCHGISDIIGTDVPRHVKAKHKADDENPVLSGHGLFLSFGGRRYIPFERGQGNLMG
ncbi:hypothetical protein D3OALGB2SA_3218 [Olavius algarvensis associated proteobacterium Delta 3]|nr:hypothetical protein D3OALGB2SA_3218 [Olavius algarvensis associated proteobacterium Delta 3]